MNTELLPFQRDTVKWMRQRTDKGYNGGFIYHEQGLGKTICVIHYLIETNQWKGSLIVCPSSLLEMWKEQILQHSTLKDRDIGIYHGADRNSVFHHNSDNQIFLTSYTIIAREYKQYAKTAEYELEIDNSVTKFERHFFNRRFPCIALDEAHYIRNRKSDASIGVCNFLKSDLWWILTATPIMNGLDDVYPHFRLLDIKGIETIQDFRKVVPKSNIGLGSVNEIIKRHGIRYLKKDVLDQLAAKNEHVMTLPFTSVERAFYKGLLKYSQARLEQLSERSQDLGNSEVEKIMKKLMSMSTLTLILRLKQCCNSPALILRTMKQLQGQTMEQAVKTLEYYNEQRGIESECIICMDKIGDHIINPCGHKLCGGCNDKLAEYGLTDCPMCRQGFDSIDPICKSAEVKKVKATMDMAEFSESTKVKKIIDLTRETIRDGKKIVIVSQWVSMLGLLSETIGQVLGEKVLVLSGKYSIKERHTSVKLFQEKDKYKIMLVSLNSSAEGITLTAAQRLVHIDIWWNKGKESQVTDRIHRIGQTGTAEIIHLRIENSIEQLIAKIVDKKRKIGENALSKDSVERIKTQDDGWIKEIVQLVSRERN